MAVRKPHIYESGYYFITFTNTRWLPLIAMTNAYDAVYNWFDYLKQQNHQIISYVIMPNHIHLLLAYKKNDKSLNTLVGNGKRFMSYEIIESLKRNNNTDVLQQLQDSPVVGVPPPTTKSRYENNKKQDQWSHGSLKECDASGMVLAVMMQ